MYYSTRGFQHISHVILIKIIKKKKKKKKTFNLFYSPLQVSEMCWQEWETFGSLFGVLWHIYLRALFNVKSIFVQNNQFYFKQFSLAWLYSLIVKKHLYLKLNSSNSSNSV